MKKILPFALAGIITASALASCAPARDRLDSAISLASSDAAECAAWLDERLEDFPTEVILGIGSNEAYGIDMSGFEEDGYIVRSIGNDTLVFGASADGLDRAVRAYAKAADAGAASTLDVTYHEGARIKRLTIADRDISEYTVVYYHDRDVKNNNNEGPTFGNAMFGAEQFVRLVEVATGITLTAVPHTEKVSGPMIFIDYYAEDDLGKNGFTYKVENGNVYINGVGTANGCANAVYYFFEHECGWDALIFGDSDLREADHVNVPNGVSVKIKPMFDYMNVFHYLAEDDYDTDKDSFSYGYKGSVAKAYHEIGTIAGTPGKNICPTDRHAYLDVLDNVIEYIQARENAGEILGEDFYYIGLGMEDNTNFCTCEDCVKVFKNEGRTLSGAQVLFANKLSEDVEAEGYLGMKYNLYSYAGSNKPCITPPRHNVYVTYCTNGHCQNHKLDGSQCTGEACEDMSGVMQKYYAWNEDDPINNTHFAEWARGWGELSENVYLYGYLHSRNFSNFTNSTLFDDLKFVDECGINGIIFDTSYDGFGLNRLNYQLIYEMIFHPEMTEAEYAVSVDEIMCREYGEGYELIKSYVNLWRQTEVNTGCWYGWVFNRLISPSTCDTALYAELAPQMSSLLREAMKHCSTKKQENRVKRLLCDVYYREAAYKYFPAYDAGDTETIEYLEERFNYVVEVLEDHGFVFETTDRPYYSFGPSYAVFYDREIQDTLIDAAWIDWIQYRDVLTPEGTTQRPMPDGYEPYDPNE